VLSCVAAAASCDAEQRNETLPIAASSFSLADLPPFGPFAQRSSAGPVMVSLTPLNRSSACFL